MREATPEPELVNDRWWVAIPKPRAFKTQKQARQALLAFRRERGCLYLDCWAEGHDIGWGRGFRFCPRHEANAWKVLRSPVLRDAAGRRILRSFGS